MEYGHRILLGNRSATYLTPLEDLPDGAPAPVGYDLLEDLLLRRHPRMRRVLTTLIRPAPLYYGLLHWSDDTDLDALDRLIVGGDIQPAGLATALLMEPRSVTCRNCDAILRLAVPDAGNPLVTTARLQGHRFVNDCPICNQPLGLLVAEVLG